MKVSVPEDFGNTSKKPVLPLVPEPIKSIKKEYLTTVNLYSDPGDHGSTQVKFSFKGLDGDHETPREILEWRHNVDRALTGLDLNANGLSSYNMCKQFMWGSALSSFIAKAGTILVDKKAEAIVTAELARDNYPAATDAGHIITDFNALRTAVVTANTCDPVDHLSEAYGPDVIKDSLNEVVKNLLPNKTLQRVKRYLRREATKPINMGVKQHIMHVYRINTKEIARCPPAFNNTQCLTTNELIDILLFGTPKSWQREMDRQGFDPLAKTVTEVVEFMERIEMSEDFDGDRKVAAATKKGNNNKNKSNKVNSGADGFKYCMLHGNNNTHYTSECKSLMAQAKKLKGNNGANQKGKGGNKSWKSKAKDKTNDSKRELVALIKKATKVIKTGELNAVEPVKKRKVKWPSEEEELCALHAKLKDFNYEDLDKMDLKGESEDKKEEEELDLSALEEISDEVSVWMAGQDKKGSSNAPTEKKDE